jgi:multidrug efflux pump subunit AcrB
MISSLFVDRPRFAIVIALVTVIAGLVSLRAIPIAQYPDIVPPQVSVTTFYPGASAAVVEATVAQPLESQIVGVDKSIYMKSVSGNDGSYTLTVSFELGTDPDINAVNVNNRVQVALSKLPPDVKQHGVTVKKQSAALLGVIALTSPKGSHDELFISNYATINLIDDIRSTPGVGEATLFGPQDYAMRAWVQSDRLTGLGLTTADVVQAIQSQNVQAAVGSVPARSRTTNNSNSTSRPRGGWPRSTNSRKSSSVPIRTVRFCACPTLPAWNWVRPISIVRPASTASQQR